MNDAIVDEIRQVRDAYAARFNFDLDAIYRDIKARERSTGLQFVDGVALQGTSNQDMTPAVTALAIASDTTSTGRSSAAER